MAVDDCQMFLDVLRYTVNLSNQCHCESASTSKPPMMMLPTLNCAYWCGVFNSSHLSDPAFALSLMVARVYIAVALKDSGVHIPET